MFLKIWPKQRTKDELVDAIKETLAAASLEFVDLLLIHAPIDIENRVDQWKALESVKLDKLARSIGLAYMTSIQLGDLIKHCTIIPAALEVGTAQNLTLPLSSFIFICRWSFLLLDKARMSSNFAEIMALS